MTLELEKKGYAMKFGSQLRFFRQQTIDSETQKPLTQEKLGEVIGSEMGTYGYSGAAISDWERGKSRINADERLVLLSLVMALKRYCGIKNAAEANSLLEAGDYRALNVLEETRIFSNDPLPVIPTAQNKDAMVGEAHSWHSSTIFWIKQFTNNMTAPRVLRGILWMWIWVLGYYLISPSLNWDQLNTKNAYPYMVLYAAGGTILPLFIGTMTNTKDNPFWVKQQNIALRLYVYQGAYVGFNVGYFLVIPISLIQNQLKFEVSPMMELAKVTIPILIGYAGAQVIPYNIWSAYRRLNIKDGGIFFIFVFLPLLWSGFFLEYSSTLSSPFIGTIVFLSSLTIVVIVQIIKSRQNSHH